MPRISSLSRSVGLFLLPLLAACSELSPVVPTEPPEPVAEVAKLQCTVQVRASSLACATAAPTQAAGVRGAMILGGQGYYVRLTSSNVSYNAGTGILRADVTVQSLLGRMIGTSDGTTPDTVRVFFESGPTRTVGTGSVEVANEHGTGTFTRASQPYFNYPGILTTEQTSAPVEWQFSLPQTVETFVFTVYVWAPVPDPAAQGIYPGSCDTGLFVGSGWLLWCVEAVCQRFFALPTRQNPFGVARFPSVRPRDPRSGASPLVLRNGRRLSAGLVSAFHAAA